MRIFIKPEYLDWDSRVGAMMAWTEDGKRIIIPQKEMTLQNHGKIQGWEVDEMLKKGIYCIPLEKQDDVIIASRAEAMKEDFNNLVEWDEYTFRIQWITDWGIFVNPPESELTCLIHFKEVSRAKLKDMRQFFKAGETIKAMVSKKYKKKYQVSLDRKNLYPTLQEVGYRYRKDQELCVMLAQRASRNGYYCEVTPGIPGIVSGKPRTLDKLKPGQKVWAKVFSVEPEKGLKLDLIE